MSLVNVTQLRQRLQHYLTRAAAGEPVRVTHRGRLLAEIVPPTRTADLAAAARARLKGSVLAFHDPTAPVLAERDWDMNR